MASTTATLTSSPAVVPTASPVPALTLANVVYEKKAAIAYVTVNRPKVLNALNKATWTDLRTAFEDARDDAAVRGVILTGAGNKAFIAGADISELARVTAFEAEQSSRFGQEVLDLIENLGKPVIAAVNGFALGGGCETAMACTIRIAVDTAKFGQPEVTLGLVPGGGGTQRLPRLVGKGRALQLILSGEMITAQEAYRIGLVNEVEPTNGELCSHGHQIPPQPQAKDAYPWHLANRNKRGMALDLKSASAQKVLEKLAKWADVFIVNTPHPARKRLKLEYDDVV